MKSLSRSRLQPRARLRQSFVTALLGASLALFCVVIELPGWFSLWPDPGFVLPAGAALGAALGLVAAPPLGRRLLLAALAAIQALYVVVAVTPVAPWLTRGLVRNDPPLKGQADAVYVFGSGVDASDRLDATGVSRLIHGVGLVTEKRAPRLLTADIALHWTSYTAAVSRVLGQLGFPGQIRFVGPVGNSREEALRLAELFRANGWKRVIAVTSPLHTRRACAVLEQAGLEVECSAAPEARYDLKEVRDADDRIRVFGSALHERLGLWVYRHRGWVR